uniref:Uncharacterized protein n=1 Tax=Noctiluca scintillans TaxID=2966 RepID=A0A7S1B1C4_NOCSC|mmetsp:Transcript_7927/g.21869  ORF Transcript_7927/g.21869 Transcript_7927/m.21869 type:complete len:230 (+) Transcript_7927:71-760(+)
MYQDGGETTTAEDNLVAMAMVFLSPAFLFWGERYVDKYLGLVAGIFAAFVMHDFLSINRDQLGLREEFIWLIDGLVFIILVLLGSCIRQVGISILAGIMGTIVARPINRALQEFMRQKHVEIEPSVAYALDLVVVILFMFLCSLALKKFERPLLIGLTSGMGAYLAVAGVTELLEREYGSVFSRFGLAFAWFLVFVVGCLVQHYACKRSSKHHKEAQEVQLSQRHSHGP